MANRRELLELHNNDYGFDAAAILNNVASSGTLPAVSVVIPYFETGYLFQRCLHFLANAMRNYGGAVDVIVVDDGSTKKPLEQYASSKDYPWLTTVILPHNVGRTEARNAGLARANGEIIIFMDSDILVDDMLIANHITLQQAAMAAGKHAICVSFFEFTDQTDSRIQLETLTAKDMALNDFRLDCTYGATWIGCEDDKRFIGQHLRIVHDTNNFRSWKGQYKAWMLPNMILGGAFSVRRMEIMSIGGFDTRFSGYGFTETSAVTRMVAERNNVVIPCLTGGALHIEDESVNVSREEKDTMFKTKHDFYFNTFLMEEVS